MNKYKLTITCNDTRQLFGQTKSEKLQSYIEHGVEVFADNENEARYIANKNFISMLSISVDETPSELIFKINKKFDLWLRAECTHIEIIED